MKPPDKETGAPAKMRPSNDEPANRSYCNTLKESVNGVVSSVPADGVTAASTVPPCMPKAINGVTDLQPCAERDYGCLLRVAVKLFRAGLSEQEVERGVRALTRESRTSEIECAVQSARAFVEENLLW